MKKMKVICIVCARGGSKGLKNKNLKKINGKSLIYYPINDAIESGVVDTVIMSTDSRAIANEAIKHGAEVPFMRPKNLSTDLATTEAALQHALITYEKIKKTKYDICLFLTANDLFRKKEWIIKAVNLLKKKKNLESVFSGHITHKNFWEKKGNNWVRLRPWMKKYSSRQVRRFIVREDTGVCCASRAELYRNGKRIGDKVEIILNDDSFTGLDIHNLEDLKLVRAAKNLRVKN